MALLVHRYNANFFRLALHGKFGMFKTEDAEFYILPSSTPSEFILNDANGMFHDPWNYEKAQGFCQKLGYFLYFNAEDETVSITKAIRID